MLGNSMKVEVMLIRKLLFGVAFMAFSGCGASSGRFTPEYEAIAKDGHPIVITNAYTSLPNSAGGVDVTLYSKNLSAKPIKYINYTVQPYNAVSDIQYGEIRRRSSAKLEDTGPIAPMAFTGGNWSNVWYNPTIRCMRVTRVHVDFMDGSKRTYSNQTSIRKIVRSDIRNRC
jgi:hypothetical protein